MTLIVFDNFNRVDSFGSLGTAATGQNWTIVVGTWGILSNQAIRYNNAYNYPVPPYTYGTLGRAVIETLTPNNSVRASFANPQSYQGPHGLISRWEDASNYMSLVYDLNGPWLTLAKTIAGVNSSLTRTPATTLINGDVVRLDSCGEPGSQHFKVYVNDVLKVEWNDLSILHHYPMGTQAGFIAQDAIIDFGPHPNLYDDFEVDTADDCTFQSWNCADGVCSDPGDGTGTYSTLAACRVACTPESFNCIDGICVNPGDGSGTFATLAECQASGCSAQGLKSVRFDSGTGNEWYIASSITDSGEEMRSKTIKAAHATGRLTDANIQVYTYDVSQVMSTTDLEAGTGSTTGDIALDDSANVEQTDRKQVNCPNAMLSAIRIEGNDTDNEERDQVHEIVYEQSLLGVRR